MLEIIEGLIANLDDPDRPSLSGSELLNPLIDVWSDARVMDYPDVITAVQELLLKVRGGHLSVIDRRIALKVLRGVASRSYGEWPRGSSLSQSFPVFSH